MKKIVLFTALAVILGKGYGQYYNGRLPDDKELISQLKPLLERLTTEAKTHFKGLQTKEDDVSDSKIPFLNFWSPRVIDGEEKGFHQFDAAMMDFKNDDTLRATLLRFKNALSQSLGQPTLKRNVEEGYVWEKSLNGKPFVITIWQYARNVYFEMHEYHSDDDYAAQRSARYKNTSATGLAQTTVEMAPVKQSIVKGTANPKMIADCKAFLSKLTTAGPSHLSSVKGVSETNYRWLCNVPFLDFERNLVIEDGSRHYFAGIKKYTDKKQKDDDFARIADAFNQAGFGKLVKDVKSSQYVWETKGTNGTYAIIMQNLVNEIWVNFAEHHSDFSYDPNNADREYIAKTKTNTAYTNSSSGSGSGSGLSEVEKLKNETQYNKNMVENQEKLLKILKDIDKRFDECQKISNNISDASRKKNTGFYIQNETKKLAGKLIDIKYELKQILREYEYKVPSSNVASIKGLLDHAENWLDILNGGDDE